MGTAVLNPAIRPHPPLDPEPTGAHVPTADALRQQAAARIAAHRHRRERLPHSVPGLHSATGDTIASSRPVPAPTPAADPQKARIAAAVAQRYAQAQSYRAFLAAEAERATQQARAAAEIAARNAQAVAQAQQQLLETLALNAAAPHLEPEASEPLAARTAEPAPADTPLSAAEDHAPRPESPSLWPELDVSQPHPARIASARPRTPIPHPAEPHPEAPIEPPAPALRVVLYEDIPTHAAHVEPAPDRGFSRPNPWDPEASLLDEEISFRHAPVFEEPAGPPVALPANLIEFPRQLVAARKARPRYAEGPLREEHPAGATGSQLRIFEVDPAQIATTPDPWAYSPPYPPPHPRSGAPVRPPVSAAAALSAAVLDAPAHPEPQWTALWLDSPAGHIPAAVPLPGSFADPALPVLPARAAASPQLDPAAWSRRTLAAAADGAIIGVATLCFAAAFAAIAGHAALTDPTSPAALATPGTAPSIFDLSALFNLAAWSPGHLLTGAAATLHGLPILTGLGALAATGAALAFAYHALWFTFSDATPGMRFARIGLCTFADDNPTRSAMRRRVPALALSTLLFGIGFLWVLLDEDGLPWHDLISRMYPRSY